jgi:hypothetical protein
MQLGGELLGILNSARTANAKLTTNSPQTHQRNVGIGLSSVATGCHAEQRAELTRQCS